MCRHERQSATWAAGKRFVNIRQELYLCKKHVIMVSKVIGQHDKKLVNPPIYGNKLEVTSISEVEQTRLIQWFQSIHWPASRSLRGSRWQNASPR